MKYLVPVVTRLVALLWAVTLLAGACSGDGDDPDGTGATVPTAPPTSPVTTVPDVATIPATIDEAYLNEVLKALNKVEGDAVRLIVASEELPRPAVERLRAIYRGEELDDQLDRWTQQLVRGFERFKSPPGDKMSTVRQIITSGADCVYMETAEDYSEVSTASAGPFTIFVALEPRLPTENFGGYNATAWMITFSGVTPEGTDPGLSPCPE